MEVAPCRSAELTTRQGENSGVTGLRPGLRGAKAKLGFVANWTSFRPVPDWRRVPITAPWGGISGELDREGFGARMLPVAALGVFWGLLPWAGVAAAWPSRTDGHDGRARPWIGGCACAREGVHSGSVTQHPAGPLPTVGAGPRPAPAAAGPLPPRAPGSLSRSDAREAWAVPEAAISNERSHFKSKKASRRAHCLSAAHVPTDSVFFPITDKLHLEFSTSIKFRSKILITND